MKKLSIVLLILWLAPAQTYPQNQPIRQHLSYLASDELKGRFPGSEGDSLARVYIINHFRKNGLQSPFVNGEYTQSFSTWFQKRVIETNKISVVSKKAQQPLLFGEDYALLDKCGSAKFSGEVAFIGFGIHEPESGYDDYSQVNLENKIVICYWYPSKDMNPEISKLVWKYHISEKAEMIHTSGGKCAIFVLPGSFPKKDKIFHFSEKKFLKEPEIASKIPMIQIRHSIFAQMMRDNGIDLDKFDETLSYALQSQALILPETKITINFKVNYFYHPKNIYNITGMLRGKDATETLIIGAHYDHVGVSHKPGLVDSICNGADDNASGSVLMLELSQKFSESGKPDCNLLFVAFGAEEFSKLGSNYFIKNLPESIHKIKAMLNFDMVGRMKNNTLYLNSLYSAMEWEEIISKLPQDSLTFEYFKPYSGSDADYFQKKGIPVLGFFTGFHPDQHKVTDEIDKINFHGMEKTANFAFDLIKLISGKEISLTFQVQE